MTPTPAAQACDLWLTSMNYSTNAYAELQRVAWMAAYAQGQRAGVETERKECAKFAKEFFLPTKGFPGGLGEMGLNQILRETARPWELGAMIGDAMLRRAHAEGGAS